MPLNKLLELLFFGCGQMKLMSEMGMIVMREVLECSAARPTDCRPVRRAHVMLQGSAALAKLLELPLAINLFRLRAYNDSTMVIVTFYVSVTSMKR